jgi:DNA-binding YbaB/EbfC family protein
MLKELGQLFSLMRNPGKIQEEMQKYQERLGQLFAEGDAGAGMVRVKVNGRMEVVSCTLTEDAFKGGDRELLEDLIRSAVNQAMQRVRQLVNEETNKMAMTLGLPPGMGLPGLTT